MSDGLVIAVVTAVPATIAAVGTIMSVRRSKRIEHQVTPSNGTPTAAMVEQLQADLQSVKQDLQYHVTVQHGRGPIPKETP